MTARNYSNTSVQTTLSANISAGATSITIGSTTGLPVSYPYSLAIDYGSANVEVVTVTGTSLGALTVTRGQDGTSAQSHDAGATVVHAATARDLKEPQDHIAATGNVHGVGSSASVVGTDTTQTLTNKSMSGSSNTFTSIPNSALVAIDAAKVTQPFASLSTGTLAATGNATVGGTLAVTSDVTGRNLVDYISIKSYGAVPNDTGVDNAAAIDAAFAAAAAATRPTAVYIPAGVWYTATAMAGPQAHGQLIFGDGTYASRISNGTSNLFALSGTSGYLQTEWRDLGFSSTAGGGHIFIPSTSNGFSMARFYNCDFDQHNNDKSYFYHHANKSFVENLFQACTFTHTNAATVAGFDIVGAGGFFNSNRWQDSRFTHSGNYCVWIEETQAAAYASDNVFENLVLEDTPGGFATILSGNGTKFDTIAFWDLSTATTQNLIRVGKSTGAGSRSTDFVRIVRRGGSLGGGLYDIKFDGSGAAALNVFRMCGTASGGLSMDLGSNSSCSFINCSTSTTLTNVSGTAYADSAISGIVSMTQGSGSPESAVTAPVGSLWRRTDGASTTTFYVKTSGTGNTGWQPVGPILGGSATLDFGSTSAQQSAELTITVTGAAVGDPVALGLPASPPANTAFIAYVSSANTVTVRFCNFSSGAVDPASGTYKVRVLAL